MLWVWDDKRAGAPITLHVYYFGEDLRTVSHKSLFTKDIKMLRTASFLVLVLSGRFNYLMSYIMIFCFVVKLRFIILLNAKATLDSQQLSQGCS